MSGLGVPSFLQDQSIVSRVQQTIYLTAVENEQFPIALEQLFRVHDAMSGNSAAHLAWISRFGLAAQVRVSNMILIVHHHLLDSPIRIGGSPFHAARPR
jgi:hypothetical protein